MLLVININEVINPYLITVKYKLFILIEMEVNFIAFFQGFAEALHERNVFSVK